MIAGLMISMCERPPIGRFLRELLGTLTAAMIFDSSGIKTHVPVTCARTPWKEAITLPVAMQMGYVREIPESRPMLTRIPDQSLIVSEQGEGGSHGCGEYSHAIILGNPRVENARIP